MKNTCICVKLPFYLLDSFKEDVKYFFETRVQFNGTFYMVFYDNDRYVNFLESGFYEYFVDLTIQENRNKVLNQLIN